MRTRGPSGNRQSLFSFFNKSVHTSFHGVKAPEHIENVYDYDRFFSDSVIFLLYDRICSIILKMTNTKEEFLIKRIKNLSALTQMFVLVLMLI